MDLCTTSAYIITTHFFSIVETCSTPADIGITTYAIGTAGKQGTGLSPGNLDGTVTSTAFEADRGLSSSSPVTLVHSTEDFVAID